MRTPPYKVIAIEEKTTNLIKRSVVIEKRRYMRADIQITVKLHSGWCESPKVYRGGSIKEFRELIENFMK